MPSDIDPGAAAEAAAREASALAGVTGFTAVTDPYRRAAGKGVRVGEEGREGGACVVDLPVTVEYGVDCVALAEVARRRVGDAVERATGRKVAAVNVRVTGVVSGADDGDGGEKALGHAPYLDREGGIEF